MHGKGTFKGSNGDVYEGEYQNNQRNGKGTSKWTNCRVYVGDWKDGVLSGKGVMTYANGNIYEGEWKGGKKHGKGSFTTKNGDVKFGDWFDGASENLTLLTPKRAVDTEELQSIIAQLQQKLGLGLGELQSTIVQPQEKDTELHDRVVEKERELQIKRRKSLKQAGEMVDSKNEDEDTSTSDENPLQMTDKEKEMQSEIDSLKKQLKNSILIEMEDFTNDEIEVEEDSWLWL
jgi:hypothetical protein